MMTDGSEGISDELVITFSPGITYENHVIIGELIMCSQSAVKEERGLKIQIAFFDEPVEPGEILLFKPVCLVYVGPERILSLGGEKLVFIFEHGLHSVIFGYYDGSPVDVVVR